MKSPNFFGKKPTLKMLILAMGVFLAVLMAGNCVHAASCIDLADIPLDAMEQAAPGMIMFVLDDSGSMDWSMMCPPPESSGVFNGHYYIFPDPGDNLYNRSILEESDDRMMWMSQWAGYNGLYYDPATDYTPWPNRSDADIDNPRSNPMTSTPTLSMTALWHEWEDAGAVVDDSDASGFATTGPWYPFISAEAYNGGYHIADVTDTPTQYTATWMANNLDNSIQYTVMAQWRGGADARHTDVVFEIWNGDPDNGGESVTQTQVDQADESLWGTWQILAQDVTFSSRIGAVKIDRVTQGERKLGADAVMFVPQGNPVSDIARRHYFVRNDTGTFLVNLLGGNIEYYRVNLADPDDNRESVSAGQLIRLTAAEASTAGIVTGRTYNEECQNFANWYSFYRRRELTAKNAIAQVIDTMDGVYIGLIFINNYRDMDQRVLPVRVNLDNVFEDESTTLLNILYGYEYSSYSTPLRNGLKKAGRFFQGDYLKPSTFFSQTSNSTYPYFKADKGGSCQQAFTIIFTDGYYNGASPGIGNADADNNTDFDGPPFGDVTGDTLADVAMYYFERDLNATLTNDVVISQVDPADHQHMVTYTLAFGVTGALDTELYKECPIGTCPDSWPLTNTDSGIIDDMFHAAINGRGSYLSAGSTAELNAALMALSKDIESRLGSAAALATNSIQRTEGSKVYQGKYNSANWFGEVLALPLSVQTGVVGDPVPPDGWVASNNLPAWDSRNILSSDGSSGFVFEPGNLSASQVTLLEASGLGTAEQLVNFIRGDTTNNSLRNRNHPLGDVVHSAPTYFDGVVYVGANDGMLHAFDAANGVELFAYVPNLVYDHLSELADPGYSHRYYVDNSATVADVTGQHVLVGGLRKGGKGYFALNVTNPASMGAGDFLWEFPPAPDDDMGYSYSEAHIVKTEAAGHVVIFGNGYDSVNGSAVLYVLDATSGALVKKFETNVAGCNGLSTPAVVDVQLDGMVDYAFAGDLKGNMWKFDLRGENVADWKFSYQDGSTPMPLITVKNINGQVQPITVAPEVMLDCVAMYQGRGLMVIFGTGQYLNSADFNDTTVQSVYGIWDWGSIWEATDGFDVAKTKYMGTLNTDRSLSNTTATLLEQVFTDETAMWWIISDYKPDWYSPVDGTGTHAGWYFDLPESDEGERLIRKPLLRRGTVVLLSTIPSSSPCDTGGRSTMYILNACSGGRTETPEFDVNNDKLIKEDDVILTGSGEPKDPDGKKIPVILYDLLEVGDRLYAPDSDGNIPSEQVVPNPAGMFFWRVVGQ